MTLTRRAMNRKGAGQKVLKNKGDVEGENNDKLTVVWRVDPWIIPAGWHGISTARDRLQLLPLFRKSCLKRGSHTRCY